MADIEFNLQKLENYYEFMAKNEHWYISNRIEDMDFFDHFKMGRRFLGKAIYYFTTLQFRKELCMELYPDGSPHGNGTVNFYDHCALAYTNHKGMIEDPIHEVFFDYSDM